MTSSLSSSTSSCSNSAVAKSSYQPRQEVPCWDKPFNWTVNGLRSIENLGVNCTNVDCLELAKNIAKFFLAFAVSVLTLPTILAPVLLAREYSIQKQNEAYFSTRRKQHKTCKKSFQKALAKSKKKEEKSKAQVKTLKTDHRALEQQVKQLQAQIQTDSNIPDTYAVLQAEIDVLKQNIANFENQKAEADSHARFYYDQVQRYKEQVQNLLVRAGFCTEEEKANAMQRLIKAQFQEGQAYDVNTTYENEPFWTLLPLFARLSQLEQALTTNGNPIPAYIF